MKELPHIYTLWYGSLAVSSKNEIKMKNKYDRHDDVFAWSILRKIQIHYNRDINSTYLNKYFITCVYSVIWVVQYVP